MPNEQVSVFSSTDEINNQLTTLSQKYLGNKVFVLSGTNTGYTGAEITPLAPYTNLTNRYFPTVATLPQLSSNIVTRDQLGGYFTPNNLGVSVYQARNLTSYIDVSKIEKDKIYEYTDPSLYNKGRGLTLTDQDEVIIHVENKDWLKHSQTDTQLDGNIRNTEYYQKFIPYQSNLESQKLDNNGVITVKDDFEYWTGSEKNIWVENSRYSELNWLKYFDLEARTKYTIITPDKELYSWHSDVYGNQYALYKPTLSARNIYRLQNSIGELWVRTANNSIYTSIEALSGLYSKRLNQTTLYNQLTSSTIKNFEVFFDTLVYELSGYVVFEKITYDYDNDAIKTTDEDFLILDLTTSLPTQVLSSTSLTAVSLNSLSKPYYGGIWYNEQTKKFTACVLLSTGFTNPTSGIIVPVLYEYDINKPSVRKRIYPTNTTDFNEYIYYRGASAEDPDKELLTYIEAPVLTYNKTTNSYFITFLGYVNQQLKIINYNTGQAVFGNVLATETNNPITTETSNPIQVV